MKLSPISARKMHHFVTKKSAKVPLAIGCPKELLCTKHVFSLFVYFFVVSSSCDVRMIPFHIKRKVNPSN